MTLTVADLFARKDAEAARKRAEAEAAAETARAERAAYTEKVMSYKLTEEDEARAMSKIAKAFENGEREVMLAHFPSSLCEDSGRRINNQLEGWQETLPGAFRDVHRWWETKLQPGGFGFAARVITYPGGMPGEVGIFITWPQTLDR
ncbi:hypothetical protein DFH01_06505 [Falsiroseomonas bella]|uniref:Uncharacterized protein n=1 Tax=Falsiroseomonas bella TaxID=2184016 RepID=A0A317FJS2_9PROT|nr:hypothetical protein [Falsiroseomonas bella]PWS38893.1 hypothetical protein DFH01_06505 [Falsiroseomonas bella]